MAHKKVFVVPFRRKRQGKTDYKKRLALLKSGSLRLVIRKSNKHMQAQLVKYGEKGDLVLETVTSKHLKEYGWDMNTGNMSAAYLVGLLIGKKAEGKEAIIDLGLQTPISGSKLFAVLKGAVDGGLKIKYSDEVLPSEERIILKDQKNADKIKKSFEKTKEKILSAVKK
jgi:large subunit ribosomal protein L18